MRKDELKLKPSPALRAIRLMAILGLLLSVLCTYLSAEDLRTKKQKEIDHHEYVVSNPVFDEAVYFAKRILNDPNDICHWSEVSEINVARSSGGVYRVQIVLKSGENVNFSKFSNNNEGYTEKGGSFSLFVKENRITDSIYISGDDLDILYGEAKKN